MFFSESSIPVSQLIYEHLKGPGSPKGLVFCSHAWRDKGLNRKYCKSQGWFLNFKGAPPISIEVNIFFPVDAKLGFLYNVFPWFLIGQQGLGHFFSHRSLLPIGWRILQTVRQRL
jgi:hypothetical protein